MAYSTGTIVMAQPVVVPLGPVPLGVAITQGFKAFLQVVRRRPVCERVSEVLSDVPANKNVVLASWPPCECQRPGLSR